MLAGGGADGNGPLLPIPASAKMTAAIEDRPMRHAIWAMMIGLAFAAIGATADTDDAASLIDRALQAAGGADKLAQPRAYTFKQDMTTRTKKNPTGLTSHTTFWFQPPKKMRMEEEGELNGKTIKYVEVING